MFIYSVLSCTFQKFILLMNVMNNRKYTAGQKSHKVITRYWANSIHSWRTMPQPVTPWISRQRISSTVYRLIRNHLKVNKRFLIKTTLQSIFIFKLQTYKAISNKGSNKTKQNKIPYFPNISGAVFLKLLFLQVCPL